MYKRQECGHAMQYDEEYFPIKIRAAVIPIANIGSALSWPIILLGLFLGATGLMQLGVVLFSLVVVFQLLTLPVEFDASARALRTLRERNMLESCLLYTSFLLHMHEYNTPDRRGNLRTADLFLYKAVPVSLQ